MYTEKLLWITMELLVKEVKENQTERSVILSLFPKQFILADSFDNFDDNTLDSLLAREFSSLKYLPRWIGVQIISVYDAQQILEVYVGIFFQNLVKFSLSCIAKNKLIDLLERVRLNELWRILLYRVFILFENFYNFSGHLIGNWIFDTQVVQGFEYF